jgi:hypothetical protein
MIQPPSIDLDLIYIQPFTPLIMDQFFAAVSFPSTAIAAVEKTFGCPYSP